MQDLRKIKIKPFSFYVIENFKRVNQHRFKDNLHILDLHNCIEQDLIELKKNIGKTRGHILILAFEPQYFDPESSISKQWLKLSDLLIKYQIFNCDFFVTSTFCTPAHISSIEYLNTNYFDWSFHNFDIAMPYISNLTKSTKSRNDMSELLLDECLIKFSYLNVTHRMHRQLFSKFLLENNLVADNLIAINPRRPKQNPVKPTTMSKPLIPVATNDDWFRDKYLLDLWRDVPLQYHLHPAIDDNLYSIDINFLHKASFNIVSETVFNFPSPFCTEKTMQSLLSKRPFIMIGPCNTLQHLRDQGYKTFSGIVDESYDNIADPNKRLRAIMQLVLELNKKSQQECNDMVYAVKDVLKHNYCRACEMIENFTNTIG